MNAIAAIIKTMQPITPARGLPAGHAIAISPIPARTTIKRRNLLPSAINATCLFLAPSAWRFISGPRLAEKRKNVWSVALSTPWTVNTLIVADGRSAIHAIWTSLLPPINAPSSHHLSLPLRNNATPKEKVRVRRSLHQNSCMQTSSAC